MLFRLIPFQLASISFICLIVFWINSYAWKYVIVLLVQSLSILSFFRFLPSGMMMYQLRSQYVFDEPGNYFSGNIIIAIVMCILILVTGRFISYRSILKSF